jgi:hypothetical protein
MKNELPSLPLFKSLNKLGIDLLQETVHKLHVEDRVLESGYRGPI